MKPVLALIFAMLLALSLSACDNECATDAECDDDDPCNTTQGVCRQGLCTLEIVGRCCERDSDCQDRLFCNGREECTEGRCEPGAFDCTQPGYVCYEDRDECYCSNPDVDGDGADSNGCGGTDCDDNDASRYPGGSEICDAEDHDEDCNPSTYGPRDADGDGYDDSSCRNEDASGDESSGTDCDDHRAGTHPGVPESCNSIDDDCDGAIDEGVVVASYVDADGDGYGIGDFEELCAGMSGYSNIGGDCDDDLSQVHPGAFRCVASGEPFEIEFCEGDWGASEECPGQGTCVPQPDGTGVCLMSTEATSYACSDGDDNDDDGLVDWISDPECASPLDDSEGPRACGDGQDNDLDGHLDFPSDPGCTSLEDGSENNPGSAPTCANGIDDDGDGTRDYLDGTGDPGCVSAADTSERETTGPACDNGIDDDDDTFTDFPDDVACGVLGPTGTEIAACNNGLDDDGDGNIDLADSGCISANDSTERLGTDVYACDNGEDDDGDGASDYPGDVQCDSPEDNKEDS